jgi:hypothetical protein
MIPLLIAMVFRLGSRVCAFTHFGFKKDYRIEWYGGSIESQLQQETYKRLCESTHLILVPELPEWVCGGTIWIPGPLNLITSWGF